MSVEFVTRSKLCERLEATKTPSGWTWNSIDQTGRRHDLPSPADASAFWSTVEKAEETGRRLDAGERQTFSALITEFKNSAAFRLKGTAATVITEPQDEAKPRSKRRGIQKSTQGLAKSTRDQYARYMRLIEQAWGSDPVRALTTRDAQKAIDAFVDDDEPAAGAPSARRSRG